MQKSFSQSAQFIKSFQIIFDHAQVTFSFSKFVSVYKKSARFFNSFLRYTIFFNQPLISTNFFYAKNQAISSFCSQYGGFKNPAI